MKTLILKKTASHYGEAHWPDNDFVVLNDARQVIGRIMLHPQAPTEDQKPGQQQQQKPGQGGQQQGDQKPGQQEQQK